MFTCSRANLESALAAQEVMSPAKMASYKCPNQVDAVCNLAEPFWDWLLDAALG